MNPPRQLRQEVVKRPQLRWLHQLRLVLVLALPLRLRLRRRRRLQLRRRRRLQPGALPESEKRRSDG
jgi:hypothetical protein